MFRTLPSKLIAAAVVASAALGAVSTAQARPDVQVTLGLPLPPLPPIFIPAPVVVRSEPVVVQPRPVYTQAPVVVYERPGEPQYRPGFERERGWRDAEWHRREWERREWERRYHHASPRPMFDQDRDGVPDRYDRDRDGDGVPNRYDRRPDNPYRR